AQRVLQSDSRLVSAFSAASAVEAFIASQAPYCKSSFRLHFPILPVTLHLSLTESEGQSLLSLQTSHGQRDCQGISRRDFLRAGVLGVGGLILPWLLEQKARAAAAGTPYVKNKSVILIFLAGGASHIETFNPNMDAPEPFRSVTGAVRTSVPGMML